jgi:hypothetical protein
MAEPEDDTPRARPHRSSPNRRFWIVTTYYNPCAYRSRLENYHHFRRGLSAPLLTIELARPGRFELTEEDATRLVRVESDDVLWHKERLINLALDHLPPECEELAWLDCDILFESDAWIDEASLALKNHALVQCFTRVRYLPRNARLSAPLAAQTYLTRPSLGARLQRGEDVFSSTPTSLADAVRHGVAWSCAAGAAWSMRRDVLASVGLYDAMIVGGNDGALAHAALGEPDRLVRMFRFSPAHAEHYLDWAAKFRSIAEDGIGVVAGDIYHLWHGNLRDRRYGLRQAILRKFAFDPNLDVGVAESGCWRWTSDKPALHQAIADFFASRREDG